MSESIYPIFMYTYCKIKASLRGAVLQVITISQFPVKSISTKKLRATTNLKGIETLWCSKIEHDISSAGIAILKNLTIRSLRSCILKMMMSKNYPKNKWLIRCYLYLSWGWELGSVAIFIKGSCQVTLPKIHGKKKLGLGWDGTDGIIDWVRVVDCGVGLSDEPGSTMLLPWNLINVLVR
jgi:hypothetical protein